MNVQNFEWVTDLQPTKVQIAKEQEDRGYHPVGYDGPFNIITVPDGNGRFKTTWYCCASCD